MHTITLKGSRYPKMPTVVNVEWLECRLERPLEFNNAGIFLEQFEYTSLTTAKCVGLRRLVAIARSFNPARLPA